MDNDHLNKPLPLVYLNTEHDDHLNPPDSSTPGDEPIKMDNSAARDLSILINESDDDEVWRL
jgi:hypothetical protein